jgi:trehalose-phosphatase
MQLINDRLDLDEFFEGLARPNRSLLFLDYDGTLAPFRDARDQAFPYPGVVPRLERLMEQPTTRVALISGRWSRDLRPLLGMENPPEIWGCHGLEKPDGTLRKLGAETEMSLEEARKWAARAGLADQSEPKPASLAFHWRGIKDDEATRIKDAVTARWPLNQQRDGLILKEFDGGLELRPVGLGKDGAVKAILEEIDISTPVAYLGDDLTDEDAFKALGDRGLKVLVRSEPRETLADLRIEPPDELLEFLDRWLKSQK